MPSFRFWAQVALAFVLAQRAYAVGQSHTITFKNACQNQSAYPELIEDGKNVLINDSYVTNGEWNGIAYLQTGDCLANGEGCVSVEINLADKYTTVDISLICPHLYNTQTSFAYYGGNKSQGNCDGVGKNCDNLGCMGEAFFYATDYVAQAYCSIDDVNLLIAFCANASEIVLSNGIPPDGSSPTGSPSTTLLPTPGAPSGTPSSGSSLPGSVTPTTGAPTPTNTGCWNTGYTTPTSTPPPTDVSDPGTLSTNTPPGSVSPSSPTPTPTKTPTPTTPTPTKTPTCKPRPTSPVPSNSAPTSPAVLSSASASTPSSPSVVRRRRHWRRQAGHY